MISHIKRSLITREAQGAFWAKRPIFLGEVGRFRFYEDPDSGDEETLWAVRADGAIFHTEFWELPALEEV